MTRVTPSRTCICYPESELCFGVGKSTWGTPANSPRSPSWTPWLTAVDSCLPIAVKTHSTAGLPRPEILCCGMLEMTYSTCGCGKEVRSRYVGSGDIRGVCRKACGRVAGKCPYKPVSASVHSVLIINELSMRYHEQDERRCTLVMFVYHIQKIGSRSGRSLLSETMEWPVMNECHSEFVSLTAADRLGVFPLRSLLLMNYPFGHLLLATGMTYIGDLHMACRWPISYHWLMVTCHWPMDSIGKWHGVTRRTRVWPRTTTPVNCTDHVWGTTRPI